MLKFNNWSDIESFNEGKSTCLSCSKVSLDGAYVIRLEWYPNNLKMLYPDIYFLYFGDKLHYPLNELFHKIYNGKKIITLSSIHDGMNIVDKFLDKIDELKLFI